jgi:hypothetical protein
MRKILLCAFLALASAHGWNACDYKTEHPQYPKSADKSTIEQSKNFELEPAYAACGKDGKNHLWMNFFSYTENDKCIVDNKQIKAAEKACDRAVKGGKLANLMTLAEAKEKDPDAFNDPYQGLRSFSIDYYANLIPFQKTHNRLKSGEYKDLNLNHGTMQRGDVIRKAFNLLEMAERALDLENRIGYCDFQNNSYDVKSPEKQSPASWVCFDEGTRKIKMVYSLPAYANFGACYNGANQINAFIKDCTENQKGYANLLPLKDTELNDVYPAWASNPSQPLAQAMGSWKGVSTEGEIEGAYSMMSMNQVDRNKRGYP